MDTVFEYVKKIRKESVAYHHEGSVPEVAPPRKEVKIDWVTEELIEKYIELDRRQEKFQYFLDVGHSGLLAYDTNSWVAYGWIAKPESLDTPYQLPDWTGDLDLYWLFFARTKEKYQQNGWHKYLLAERLKSIYNSDSDAAIFTDTNVENISRFSILSSGFDPLGKITAYRFGYPPNHVKAIGYWNWESSHPPLPEIS